MSRIPQMRMAALGLLGLCAAVPELTAAQQRNPYEGDEAAVRAGSALFASRCSDCHGADAKGARGPDLTLLWGAGASDERVFKSIRFGVAGSIMPPSTAADPEVWAVVAYLRSISTVPPLQSSGNLARGAELFAAECSGCHRVGARGGVLGPELTRIGESRSREALVSAIREPGADVPLGYRAVTAVSRAGARIEGVAKAEDAFSIQILANDGRLLGFRKVDLAELVQDNASPMPTFRRGRLSERELEDLLAFLGTLRGAPRAEPL